MPSFPDLQVPLTDGTTSVRMAAERDIPEILIAYQDDPELPLRLGTPRPPSGAELGRRAERAEHDRMTGQGVSLTMVEGDDDTCVGQIDVHGVEWEHSRADLAVWVTPVRRGLGLARRGLALAGPWLIGEAGLDRLQIVTEPDNEPLLRAAQGAGFQFEGVLRGYYRGPDGRADMAILSLVRSDLRG